MHRPKVYSPTKYVAVYRPIHTSHYQVLARSYHDFVSDNENNFYKHRNKLMLYRLALPKHKFNNNIINNPVEIVFHSRYLFSDTFMRSGAKCLINRESLA